VSPLKGLDSLPAIPGDATYRLPDMALVWTQKAHLSIERAKFYRFMWSQQNEALIIPIQEFKTGQHIGHISRYFSGDSPTRYRSSLKAGKGLAGLIRGLETVFIVEDWLSCLRLADLGHSAVCLMGTSLSKQGYWELVNTTYSKYVVWLDNDSKLVREKARAIQSTLIALGKDCLLVTGRDEPKTLSGKELSSQTAVLLSSTN
jgi:DNA primase